MKTIHIPLPLTRRSHYYYDNAKLQEHDLKTLPEGTDLLVYYYGGGSYEGLGHALFRCNGSWYHADLGHCSCYGPGDGFILAGPIACFKEWLEASSQEFRDEVQPLIEALEKELNETH